MLNSLSVCFCSTLKLKKWGRQISQYVPEEAVGLWRFIADPSIPGREGSFASVLRSAVLALSTTLAVGITVPWWSDLFVGLLQIDSGQLFNWPLLTAMLLLNTTVFILIFYAVLLPILWLKSKGAHLELIAHGLRFFAIENICLAALMVLCLNRIIVTGSPALPTGTSENLLAGAIAFLALALGVRLLILPVCAYLARHYRRAFSYFLGIGAIAVAMKLNPTMPTHYFEHIVKSDEFCSELISVQMESVLETGLYSKDCLMGKCAAVHGKHSRPNGIPQLQVRDLDEKQCPASPAAGITRQTPFAIQ